MKKHLLLSAFFAASSVFAAELSVKAAKPWKTVEETIYSIEFDGSKTYPLLSVSPQTFKENTYYKFSFEANVSGLRLVVCYRGKNENGAISKLLDYFPDMTGWKRYTFYFRTGKGEETAAVLFPRPGKAGRALVRNISLDEVADFGKNLLSEGDFECGSVLLPRHKRFEGQLSIVDSPAFLGGEKSLKMVKNANDFAAGITGDLPAVPGKTVKIRFWVKAEQQVVSGMMYLDFFRSGHKKHLLRRMAFKAEPEWKEYSYSYTIPSDTTTYTALTEGMARIQFHLLESPSGAAVYFDGLEYWME